MTIELNRRLLLKGLGGAALAAPFLSSVIERAARAQGVPTNAAPKRLIVMFTHHGCLTDRWFPTSSHGPLTPSDLMGTSLEAMAPYAEKLLLPRGIRAMNQWTSDLSLGQGNDSHTQVVGSYFTCAPVTPNEDDPFSFKTETKYDAMPTAASLDHICARQVNQNREPFFMRVGGAIDTPNTGISYSAAETPYPGVGTLSQAFGALTGLFSGDGSTSADDYRAMRGQSIIDIVRDDLETLERYDMSASDKEKLGQWKALLDDTGRRVVSAQCSKDVTDALGLSTANFQTHADVAVDKVSETIAQNLDGADLYSNIAVLSALCDQSRVIFLKYPGLYTYSGIGLEYDNQAIGARIRAAYCTPDDNEFVAEVDRYYALKFAHLVSQLDSFNEGDGTLLDNTATVWFQEMSDGNQRNLNNMPLLQAGGCGGYFQTGQIINVEDATSDLHRGSSSEACSLDTGAQTESGTPIEFGNAPINKYYCNLMNAIGVKAGEDGFPREGGVGKVTHFGTYDETRDFIGGGTNPPMIHDPGEFDELTAKS